VGSSHQDLKQAILDNQIEKVSELLQDPRVANDRTVFEMAQDELFRPDINELIITEYRKIIQNRAKNLLALERIEKYGIGKLSNNIQTYMGSMISGKVGPNLQSQRNKLKENYLGLQKTRKRK